MIWGFFIVKIKNQLEKRELSVYYILVNFKNSETMSEEPKTYFGIKFKSQFVDPEIFRAVRLIQTCFFYSDYVKFHKIQLADLEIKESESKGNFFYVFENKVNKRTLFVGRDYKNEEIKFLIKDESRIRWGLAEGFTLDEVYTKVGTLAYLKTINDATGFLLGRYDYKVKGKFLTC